MRLTAVDIHSTEFTRGVRGYNTREVDDFRQEVADNFEEVQLELAATTDGLEKANKELDHYRSLEKSMNESLIFAQRSADEVRANSHKEAELILRKAENEAREIVANARSERTAIERQIAELEAARDRFAEEFTAMIAALGERLDSFRGRPAYQRTIGEQQLPHPTPESRPAEPPPIRAVVPDWLGHENPTQNGNSSS